MQDVQFGFLEGGNKRKRNKRQKDKDQAEEEKADEDLIVGSDSPVNIDFSKDQKEVSQDLTFALDYSYRDDVTQNYRLDVDQVEELRGAETHSFNFSVEYVLNARINLRFFIERNVNTPKGNNSVSLGNSNTRGGITVRFSLQ
jgi:cell surface protein SprA